jgi:hypothetical protein
VDSSDATTVTCGVDVVSAWQTRRRLARRVFLSKRSRAVTREAVSRAVENATCSDPRVVLGRRQIPMSVKNERKPAERNTHPVAAAVACADEPRGGIDRHEVHALYRNVFSRQHVRSQDTRPSSGRTGARACLTEMEKKRATLCHLPLIRSRGAGPPICPPSVIFTCVRNSCLTQCSDESITEN